MGNPGTFNRSLVSMGGLDTISSAALVHELDPQRVGGLSGKCAKLTYVCPDGRMTGSRKQWREMGQVNTAGAASSAACISAG